jgi:acyl-CoA thioester hydrolase
MMKNELKKINEIQVRPDWIDHNHHLNVAYYVLIFDQSLDNLVDEIELTRAYRKESGNTIFVLETHVTYVQEVKESDMLEIYARVVDYDEKRIHLFLEMYHKEDGFLSATSEQMIMHIDTSGPKATPMPVNIQENLKKYKELHAHLPLPPQAGARVGIRPKKAS